MNASLLAALPPPVAAVAIRAQAFYRRHGGRLPGIAAFLLALVIARQAAALLWLLVPQPEATRWRPAPPVVEPAAMQRPVNAEAVAQAHLFGEYQVVANANAQSLASAPETTLAFTLLGILAGTSEAESIALIAKDTTGNDEAPYKIGEDVAPGVNLQAIFLDRVILSRNGQLETLRLDKNAPSNAEVFNAVATPAAPAQEGTPEAAAQLANVRTQVLTDPSKAANFIRIQPLNTDGGVRGYRVYPGQDRDAFAAAGLKAGDVVTAINGTPLDNPAQALQMLQSLSTAGALSLAVERNGEVQTVNVNLTP